MSRFWRVNTIWRKELKDILRDRRTVIAMVLVPIVLYPALMLGSLQAFELQTTRLKEERFRVVVPTEELRTWLRKTIDTDPTVQYRLSRPLRGGSTTAPSAPADASEPDGPRDPLARNNGGRAAEAARTDVRSKPPEYDVAVARDVVSEVTAGRASAGLLLKGEIPGSERGASAEIAIVRDETDIRSELAAAGLEGILGRASEHLLQLRLERLQLPPNWVRPLALNSLNVATPEKVGGSILGQIVPLILIIMTITGAIYPAIDLTAGERERGTLETLMVAPVPTVELIAGKFVVVTLIGMMSAALNLLSIGGTIYLGGLGELLTRGNDVVFPLRALPIVLLLLVPLAVLFSAMLLAVCSFARSFKEAQNYIVPVMMAAMIPAIVGVLPGTRLEGPILILPVANIVVLTRELFMGHFPFESILWVLLSTSVYAGAAVAVAARLFGQEAVLFADSASLRTMLQRRFFKPRSVPTAAQAFLLLGLIYPAQYYAQLAIGQTSGIAGTIRFCYAMMFLMIALYVLVPCFAALYARVRVPTALAIADAPPARAWLAALCFGASTWILTRGWIAFQQWFLPLAPEVQQLMQEQFGWIDSLPLGAIILFFALVPAVCEEVFFRGYVLSGLRRGLGPAGAIFVVAIAFGIFHGSAHRLIVTTGLGALFGLLVIRYRSVLPAVLAHFMHNALSMTAYKIAWLGELLTALGLPPQSSISEPPPLGWLAIAAGLLVLGLVCCCGSQPDAPRRAALHPREAEARVEIGAA